MRPIKFRAWQRPWKKMFILTHHDGKFLTGNEEIETCDFNSPIWIVMQFTGLLDKNGKEIYEGDILSYEFPNPSACYIDVIEWQEGMTECCQSSYDGYETKNIESSRIIGNIHENPELLNK